MSGVRAVKRWVGIGLVLALCACGGGGSPGPRLLELGTDVVLADLDGDGRADVLTLTHLFGDRKPEGRLAVYRQTASGVFAAAETYVVGCYPWAMTLADIDGDGRPDLVVTDVGAWNCTEPQPGNAIYLLRQDATNPGRFLAPQKLISGVNSYQIAVVDFNGDGAPDLATGGLLSDLQALVLLPQDPQARGAFLPPTRIAMPGSVSEIVAGDIDGDGRSDLFFHMSTASGSTLASMPQRPGSGLAASIALAPQAGHTVQRLAVLDVNGDGRPDLIAHLTPQSTAYAPKLTVLLQGASPWTWSAPVDTSLAGIEWTDGTAFGDLNADGRSDVALVGWRGSGGPYGTDWQIDSRVNLILNTGQAGYSLASVVPLPRAADQATIGDVDGDGRNDLVLSGGSGDVLVMLQSRTVPGSFGAPRPLR